MAEGLPGTAAGKARCDEHPTGLDGTVAREIVRDDQRQEFVDVHVRDKHQLGLKNWFEQTTRMLWPRASRKCWKWPATATGRPMRKPSPN